MAYFEKYIKKQFKSKMIDSIEPNDKSNVAICCPFPHKEEYVDSDWNTTFREVYEQIPTALINLDIRTFHCQKCDVAMTESEFEEIFEVEDEKEVVSTFSKLDDNIQQSNFKMQLKSKLQIVAVSQMLFSTYDSVEFIPKRENQVQLDELINKTKTDEDILETKSWSMYGDNCSMLKLIEGRIQDYEIDSVLADICGLGKKWSNTYNIKKGKLQAVYKFSVTDTVTELDEKYNETVIDLYAFQPLEVGRIYDIEYTIYPRPTDKQKVVMVASKINLDEEKFEINTESKKILDIFKSKTTIEDTIDKLYQSARCHIAPYLKKDLWFLMDLVFNSPLDITYQKPIRGALDVFVLGDTRTGKSETSKTLRDLYDFGSVVNLKTATVPSLVGGSDDSTKTVKLGVLPRKHKELVVLEEFSGAPTGFIKTLTEIRSSCMVKISRVKAELQAPCKLRMITISNPVSDVTNSTTISNFPNGIEPINELINAPEDVARYDAFILVPKVTERDNPFDNVLDKKLQINKENYEKKIKWIKTLKADNVIISNMIGSYIFDKSQELNKMFECSFTLFGSETDKKLARMSAALACMLCSTEDYLNVEVKQEHVDYIFDFLVANYDNDLFRLKHYADEEKSFIDFDDDDVSEISLIYYKNTTMVNFLANNSRCNRNELQAISGLYRDDFSLIFNKLASFKFIKVAKDQVIPTIKFRECYKRVKK